MPYMRQSELESRAGAGNVARAIGGRVRQGRSSRGWTLDQLAERSGVSRRMLVSIEQGAANPRIATVLLISDAIGMGVPANARGCDVYYDMQKEWPAESLARRQAILGSG